MFRIRSSSTNARSEPANLINSRAPPSDVSSMSLLGSSSSNNNARNRAIENDYTEHPGQRLRPGSAPASSGVLTSSIRDAGRHREDRHHRHHRDQRHRNRSRRHCHALPLPGSATRMTTASLPSHLVSRDLRLADSGRFAPAVPARPFTIGHSQPRRQLSDDVLYRSRPAPPLPTSSDSPPLRRTANVAPPRPPPPPPEVAARLGVEVRPRLAKVDAVTQTVSTGPVQTVQPTPMGHNETIDRSKVVISQPKPQSKKTSKATKSEDKLLKKPLVVDLKSDKSTKTSVSNQDTTLKKNLVRTSSIDSNRDDERQLLGGSPADGNGNNKLGEVCPRCKNCPRCQEGRNGEPETPRGSRHCWMCNRRCACTVHDCVEVATCVYCVRAGLYHCTNYDDNEDLADKPCSCRGTDCCLRWTALSVLSIFLPCLLCYPIAMGCSRACKACSPKQGCKCKDSYR
ncbi:uncharacterized protein LOC100179914 [Ciona intestinalis]